MRSPIRFSAVVSACTVWLIATPSAASDGRLEINQACVATGCVPGDTPGFPIQTQAGQSYVLTSNLVVPSASTHALSLADRASLDLGGFAIEGVTSCSGTPLVCSGTGTGSGVTGGHGIAVRNGAIRKMGLYGVVSYDVELDDVVIEENGSDGVHIASGPGSVVRDCRIQLNGGVGLTTAYGSGASGTLVLNNVIRGNASHGVVGGRFSLIGNTVADNGGFGFYLSYGPAGLAHNVLLGNNGGDANPQITGSWAREMSGNVCATDLTCP